MMMMMLMLLTLCTVTDKHDPRAARGCKQKQAHWSQKGKQRRQQTSACRVRRSKRALKSHILINSCFLFLGYDDSETSCTSCTGGNESWSEVGAARKAVRKQREWKLLSGCFVRHRSGLLIMTIGREDARKALVCLPFPAPVLRNNSSPRDEPRLLRFKKKMKLLSFISADFFCNLPSSKLVFEWWPGM